MGSLDPRRGMGTFGGSWVVTRVVQKHGGLICVGLAIQHLVTVSNSRLHSLQCFDAVGWAVGRASGL